MLLSVTSGGVAHLSGGLSARLDSLNEKLSTKVGLRAVDYTIDSFTIQAGIMGNQNKQDERIANMTFASVYPHYVTKIEKKARTKAELHHVIEWLTGFDEKKLQDLIAAKVTLETFFQEANLNPKAELITGVICGYRVEEIENPLTRQVRYLDKLVDELAKGKKMEKILRDG